MSESSISRSERILELVTVGVLAFGALATAWSGYQASLWDGIQSSNYTQASGSRTNAAQQRTEAFQFRLADLGIFQQYMDAVLSEDEVIASSWVVSTLAASDGSASDTWSTWRRTSSGSRTSP